MNDVQEKNENLFADAAPRGTYLLTIRRTAFDFAEAAEFRAYFQMLRRGADCEILVVDGSPPEIFASYAVAWAGECHHAAVDPQYKFLNGKVNGIHTGIDLAGGERVILADDDIRYTAADAARMFDLLADYEMVRPQNYFSPLPAWARIEAARMLINRAFIPEGDYSGTLGVTKKAFRRVGHYDGDVLFDNEEIVRHFRAAGAKIKAARDFFILKRPATFQKWLEQRPRQAYEDFVMRLKTAFFLFLPVDLLLAYWFGGWRAAAISVFVVVAGAISAAAAGLGDGAKRFFPIWIPLYAPLWFVERSFSTYLAFYWLLTRGGYPFGDKIITKGTGNTWNAPKN